MMKKNGTEEKKCKCEGTGRLLVKKSEGYELIFCGCGILR
jgi:hypothetical protein